MHFNLLESNQNEKSELSSSPFFQKEWWHTEEAHVTAQQISVEKKAQEAEPTTRLSARLDVT